MLCYCLLKRASDVAAAWEPGRAEGLRAFMERTGLGTVCTSCRGDLAVLVAAMSRGEPMPPLRADAPKLSSARRPQLPPWKRLKRAVRLWLKSRKGMEQLEFHALASAGDGWGSTLQLANFAHPDFPGRTVPLMADVRVHGPDGALRQAMAVPVPVDGMVQVDVGGAVGGSGPERRFGFVYVRYAAVDATGRRRWRVGTNRPYVTWSKGGFPLTVHEKSVHFDRWCVLPGVAGLPGFETEIALANIGETSGTVSFRIQAGPHRAEETIALAPREARAWAVPSTLEGVWVDQVEASSTVALTGYVCVRSAASGRWAIQHLVKEGS